MKNLTSQPLIFVAILSTAFIIGCDTTARFQKSEQIEKSKGEIDAAIEKVAKNLNSYEKKTADSSRQKTLTLESEFYAKYEIEVQEKQKDTSLLSITTTLTGSEKVAKQMTLAFRSCVQQELYPNFVANNSGGFFKPELKEMGAYQWRNIVSPAWAILYLTDKNPRADRAGTVLGAIGVIIIDVLGITSIIRGVTDNQIENRGAAIGTGIGLMALYRLLFAAIDGKVFDLNNNFVKSGYYLPTESTE